MKNVSFEVKVNGEFVTTTNWPVTILVTSDEFDKGDHIEIKVTDEYVIMELWSGKHEEFVLSQAMEFADFRDESDFLDEEDFG